MVLPRGAPEPRRYKYIYFKTTNAQSGWVIQMNGGTHSGYFSTQREAAVNLCKILKVKSVASLPKKRTQSTVAKTTASGFRGVHYHKSKQKFVSTTMSGLFTTARKAAGGAQGRRGLMPKELTVLYSKSGTPAELSVGFGM